MGDNDGVALSSDWPHELYHATKTGDPSALACHSFTEFRCWLTCQGTSHDTMPDEAG